MASGPSTPSTPTSPIDIEVRVATESDKDRIVDFLRRFFFRDEPLNKYLQLFSDENSRCPDLEKFASKEITDPSVIAELDGKLVGICLNGIMEKGEEEDHSEPQDKSFSKIFKLLQRVAKESNPFQHFPGAKKAMAIKIVSVDDAYRGKGIAKQLMAKTR